jgi:pentatricopeptide repeat protein
VVLEAMKKAHKTDGNIITFNIALKRLSKQGQVRACEGIMIGMLEAGVEPNVVSYTTCIGACAQIGDSAYAHEWLRRMRSRNVNPNFHTYNTALAACLDGKLQSTIRGSSIAREMMTDVAREMELGLNGPAEYNSVLPDLYTKTLARNLMKQLRDNWRAGDIDMAVAKATVRVPLLKLVDFEKSQGSAPTLEHADIDNLKARTGNDDDDDDSEVRRSEAEVDFNAVIMLSQSTARRVEV